MKKRLQNSDLLYIVVLVLFLLAAGLDVVRNGSNKKPQDNTSTAPATGTTETTATTATTTPGTLAATDKLTVGYYDAVDTYLTRDPTGKYTGKTADIVNDIAKAMGRRSVDWVALPNQKANIELLADPLTAVRPEAGALVRSKAYDVIDYYVRGQTGATVASRAALIDYAKVSCPNVNFVAKDDPAAGEGRVVRPSDKATKGWPELGKFRVPAVIGVAPGKPELLTTVNAAIDRHLNRPAS